mmetsp:Transcript_4949/g.6038  ORF Transcript_4949/g.6038 Transcript_4949/m.6038 type:complete len:111 (-) Transcript_4949:491-823(-)
MQPSCGNVFTGSGHNKGFLPKTSTQLLYTPTLYGLDPQENFFSRDSIVVKLPKENLMCIATNPIKVREKTAPNSIAMITKRFSHIIVFQSQVKSATGTTITTPARQRSNV